jgi:ATP-binding cassette, subfamily B, bacterial
MTKSKPLFREFFYNKNRPFRTFYHLFDNEQKNLGLATLFLIIKHSPVWILPVTTANIINVLTQNQPNPIPTLMINLSITAVFILQNLATHTLYVKYFAISSREIEARLRTALIQRLQQLSIAFHDTYKSGTIQSKVLRDVDSILNMITQIFSNVILAVITVIFAFVVTLTRKPVISLLFIALVPAAVILMFIFRNKMQINNTELRLSIERMSAKISEMIEMIPITRAHALEKVEMRKMGAQMANVKKRGVRLDVINAMFGATSWAVFQLFQLASLGITAYLAFLKVIPIGDVVLYQSFFGQITGAMNLILAIYPQITRGYDAFVSLGDILESPDLEQNEGKQHLADVRGDLVFQNVSFSYPEVASHAINNFSLDVHAGECIAIVGESGSGKSTLMQLLMGFRRPQSGKIIVDGHDMDEIDLRDFRRHLSVVPQNTILFSGSIRENISYGLKNVTERQIREAIVVANAAEFIDALPHGLDSTLGERGAKLSGGQKQRIAIARAVIREPKVILFDEATSSLDVLSEKLVQDALAKLIRGRTTFIVAHRLSTIRNADRIVVMKKGKAIETGTFSQLMKKNKEFAKLKSLQE